MAQRTTIVPDGQRIARVRIENGYSKVDVARKAGIPHSSVIRAERGQSVSAKTAVGICKVLGHDLDDLFTISFPGGADMPRREVI